MLEAGPMTSDIALRNGIRILSSFEGKEAVRDRLFD